jgi:hypothetical protein
MTENNLTPPPELVQEWLEELDTSAPQDVLLAVAQWGADQELEACCEWVSKYLPYLGDFPMPEDKLRAARRPKPPSLKEQAIAVLEDAKLDAAHHNILLHALEALPDD